MPKSLRNKIKHLAYKGELNERERERILNALDREVKWIPVSERLPEESGRYLVTYERYSQFYTDVAMFDIKQKGNHGFFPIHYIIAWAYLPAPYQPPKMMCEED